jgi:glucokinase
MNTKIAIGIDFGGTSVKPGVVFGSKIIAEWRFGVGGGLILGGKLFRGSQLGTGEIGRMIMEPHGVPGHYGNFGALENMLATGRSPSAPKKFIRRPASRATPEELTPLFLEKAALSGDELAAKLWGDIGFEIGIMLTNIAWLLNLDRIVIDGSFAKAGPLVFELIKRTIRERTSVVYHEHLEVVPAELGNDGGIIGSAALAVDAAERSST